MRKLFFIFFLFGYIIHNVSAVTTYYWVSSSSTNWENGSSAWSLSSGGSFTSGYPNSLGTGTDVAIFDTHGAGTCTMTASEVIASINCTGHTGTVSLGTGNTLTVNGNITLGSTVTLTQGNSACELIIGASCTLTNNNNTIGTTLLLSGSGTITLADSVYGLYGCYWDINSETFNQNGHNANFLIWEYNDGDVTWEVSVLSGDRLIVRGNDHDAATAYFPTQNNAAFDMYGQGDNSPNYTGSPSVVNTGTTSYQRTMLDQGGYTYNIVEYSGTGSGTNYLNQGGNTYTSIIDLNPNAHIFELPASSLNVINSAFTINGTSCSTYVTLESSSAGTQFQLQSSSATISVTYCYIQDSNVSGGATWTNTHCKNVSNNTVGGSGWSFNSPCAGSVSGWFLSVIE